MHYAMLPNIGGAEIAIIAVVLLLVFGPKRLPALAEGLADSVKKLRGAVEKED